MSLIKKLSLISNPNPVFIDPEDNVDETSAKLTVKGDDDENVDVGQTQLQRRASQVLVDDDCRYKGKPVTRKSALDEQDADSSSSSDTNDDLVEDVEIIQSDMSDNSGGLLEDNMDQSEADDVEESEDSENDMEAFKEKLQKSSKAEDKFVFKDDGDYGKYADEAVEDSEYSEEEGETEMNSDGSEEDEELSSVQRQQTQQDNEEDGVQSFSTVDIKEEIKKGQAAKAQIALWDNLLEYRIRLQKLLVVVNQLPQPGNWDEFTKQAGEEYQTALKQSEEALKQLLDQLTQLQSLLMSQYPGTKNVAKSQVTEDAAASSHKSAVVTAGSDEEIPSDDDEVTTEAQEKEEEEEEAEERLRTRLKRKIKMADYPGFLSKRHQLFQPFRDETIQKWYDKTRVASGKLGKGFSAFESSALKQIDQILSDKERLIKRTQLKRSTYRILGKSEKSDRINGVNSDSEEEASREEDTPVKKDGLKDYDEEIFDDDDFYHQLLRQLIERKTIDMNDPIALSRQWLEIQKLRSKVKKNVDTKASKGRKLRFDIHTKLVNFMAPFETSKWTDQARNDLYKSVFGGKTSNP